MASANLSRLNTARRERLCRTPNLLYDERRSPCILMEPCIVPLLAPTHFRLRDAADFPEPARDEPGYFDLSHVRRCRGCVRSRFAP